MFQNLVNKRLRSIFVDDKRICFVCDGEFTRPEFYFKTTSECCSETYISEVLFNPTMEKEISTEGVINRTVVGWEELKLQEGDYRKLLPRQDVDQVYGYKIYLASEDGTPDSVTIIYRNSSNGYYGGSMVETEYFTIDAPCLKKNWINPY
jgi:hypothetical protein